MEVFQDLFTDWAGLLAFVVIVITLAIPIYFFYMFINKSGQKEE